MHTLYTKKLTHCAVLITFLNSMGSLPVFAASAGGPPPAPALPPSAGGPPQAPALPSGEEVATSVEAPLHLGPPQLMQLGAQPHPQPSDTSAEEASKKEEEAEAVRVAEIERQRAEREEKRQRREEAEKVKIEEAAAAAVAVAEVASVGSAGGGQSHEVSSKPHGVPHLSASEELAAAIAKRQARASLAAASGEKEHTSQAQSEENIQRPALKHVPHTPPSVPVELSQKPEFVLKNEARQKREQEAEKN